MWLWCIGISEIIEAGCGVACGFAEAERVILMQDYVLPCVRGRRSLGVCVMGGADDELRSC